MRLWLPRRAQSEIQRGGRLREAMGIPPETLYCSLRTTSPLLSTVPVQCHAQCSVPCVAATTHRAQSVKSPLESVEWRVPEHQEMVQSVVVCRHACPSEKSLVQVQEHLAVGLKVFKESWEGIDSFQTFFLIWDGVV